jgi:hypothetical protein
MEKQPGISENNNEVSEDHVDLNLKQTVDSIIESGKITIDKGENDRIPLRAKEILDSVSKEDVIKSISESPSVFSDPFVSYILKLDDRGCPIWTSSEKTEDTLGTSILGVIKIKSEDGVDIKANAHLIRLVDQEPEIKADLFAVKSNINLERAPDDGRCLSCEGWGCWECGFTGGY